LGLDGNALVLTLGWASIGFVFEAPSTNTQKRNHQLHDLDFDATVENVVACCCTGGKRLRRGHLWLNWAEL
jgi:hypothetical protein